MIYSPKKFHLPELTGLSEKQLSAHIGLYEGYVKHVNLILETLGRVRAGALALDPYVAAELRRRLAFEFDGMRLHEYYFEQFEGGSSQLQVGSLLSNAVKEKYGERSIEDHVREVAGARGIGWVVAYADSDADTMHAAFVTEHEIGQFAGLPILLALDLWEHAYMVDYLPADKRNYVDAFFANLNWSVVERRFESASR